ncbi:MAG: DUF4105 domain-containing protein [Pirellulaceae bacterium]|nr:DUF4105 domain-containing protein [Pirellulaceae bacterium]
MPASRILTFSAFMVCGCSQFSSPAPKATSDAGPRRPLPTILASTRQSNPPSHDRPWRPNLAVLPYAQIYSNRVDLLNVRDCYYRSETDYDVRHADRTIWLNDLRTLDFIVIPFPESPALAHTMLSFGMADGQYLVFSVEARLEQHESYSPLDGARQKYELMWVVGTERDLIGLRTEIRRNDVYLYRTTANPEQVRSVFLASIARVNEIARQPEYYDTLRNNCTTNIVEMVNRLRPGTISEDIRVLLPGHSDRMLYDQGLLAVHGPFEQIKRASRINLEASLHYGSAEFSQAIRGLIQPPQTGPTSTF